MIPADNITAVILAGGAGRRAGHRDKGLIPWQGKPFIAHASNALRPQVGTIIISCNRNAALYEQFGSQTIADTRRDFQGPLAGLEAAAPLIKTELVIVVSCDMPHLSSDFAQRLLAPLSRRAVDAPEICYAHDGTRAQYLCAGIKTCCLDSLTSFLDSGQRAVKSWYASRQATAVDFSDQQACFRNYNTLS